nr:TPA_inf: venom-related protein PPI [Conus ebraeus]
MNVMMWNRVIVMTLASVMAVASESALEAKVTKEVTFDLSIGGDAVGKVVIGLFGEAVPRTVENFAQLASGENGYGYEGTPFHRVIEDFVIQGGDFVHKNGSGEKSIYGGLFDDEAMDLKHYGAGWVSMANRGPNTNSCQFFITLKATKWLDGSHVVFGKVLSGMDVVRQVAKVPTDDRDRPTIEVLISSSKVEDTYPYTVPLAGVEDL